MRKRELKNMEWGLVIVAVILTIIGLVALFSATQETEYDEFKKQIKMMKVWHSSTAVRVLAHYGECDSPEYEIGRASCRERV